jgi:RNA polymerase sigma factor (sigma-70 family)
MTPPAEGFAARLVLGPALRAQPDRRLVTLVREGYETAFEEIVRRYGRTLTRYAAAIVGSRGEDVTQEAFSKALLALRRDSEAEIELRPWLFRIVRNTALNDLRDSPPSPELLAEAIAGGRNPAEEMERREELADLMRRLRSLPDRQRAAIVMRELEGLSHEEIAAALGLSGGAARQAIFRARQALRDGLGMLLPLPLLRLLIDHGGEMAAVGAGAGGGGAAAASGALGGAGAGVALKAAGATVLVAGAIGAGVAVQHERHSDRAQAATQSAASNRSEPASAPEEAGESSNSGPDHADDHGSQGEGGRSHHGGEGEHGDDHRGPERPFHGSQDSSGPGRGGSSGESGDGEQGGNEIHGGDHHGGRGDGDDLFGGGGPSGGDDRHGQGSSGSSGHGGEGSGADSPSIAESTEGGSSGPGPGSGSNPSGGSGSGSESGGDGSSGGSGGQGGDDFEEPVEGGSSSGSDASGGGGGDPIP